MTVMWNESFKLIQYLLFDSCSMNSISTNPFDDDENADSITIASNMEYSPGQRLYKKKRRAPQPPTPTVVSIL